MCKKNLPYIHFSIDDCQKILLNLFSHNYKSIFDVSFLSYLKKLHIKYGLKVTLYVVAKGNWGSINNYDDSYINEFIGNSDWLKFALHCTELSENIEIAYQNYFHYLEILKNIVGKESLSDIARFHMFNCPREVIKNAGKNGINMLLCADDDRVSYGMSESERIKLFERNTIILNNLLYSKTAFRIENNFIKYKEIIDKYKDLKFISIFTHEWLFYGRNYFYGRFLMKRFVRIIVDCGYKYCINIPMNIQD